MIQDTENLYIFASAFTKPSTTYRGYLMSNVMWLSLPCGNGEIGCGAPRVAVAQGYRRN